MFYWKDDFVLQRIFRRQFQNDFITMWFMIYNSWTIKIVQLLDTKYAIYATVYFFKF